MTVEDTLGAVEDTLRAVEDKGVALAQRKGEVTCLLVCRCGRGLNEPMRACAVRVEREQGEGMEPRALNKDCFHLL